MARALELGPIDIDNHAVPYWLRFLGSIDRLERGASPRWPSDTRPEYAAPFEVSQSISEVVTDDYLLQRVHDVLLAVEGVEPDPVRVAQRAAEMRETGDSQIIHPDAMVVPEGGVKAVEPVWAGWQTPEERAAEEREHAAKIRAAMEGRRP